MTKKLSRSMLALLLAVSLMIPVGALQSQQAWADDAQEYADSSAGEDVVLEIKAGAATLKEIRQTRISFQI